MPSGSGILACSSRAKQRRGLARPPAVALPVVCIALRHNRPAPVRRAFHPILLSLAPGAGSRAHIYMYICIYIYIYIYLYTYAGGLRFGPTAQTSSPQDLGQHRPVEAPGGFDARVTVLAVVGALAAAHPGTVVPADRCSLFWSPERHHQQDTNAKCVVSSTIVRPRARHLSRQSD